MLQTGKGASKSSWNVGADATLVVNNLVDAGAVRHDGIVCERMAHPSDVGLVGAIVALGRVVTCLPSAIAADYDPLERFRSGGMGMGGGWGCHRERYQRVIWW